MNIKHLLLAATALVISFGANAEEPSSNSDVAALQERIAELEKEQKKNAVKSFFDKHLKLSGYIQGGFSWDDDSLQGSDKATFYLRRARVSISGDIWEDKLDYRLQVDFNGTPKVCDLYVRFRPLKEVGLQLGQFTLRCQYALFVSSRQILANPPESRQTERSFASDGRIMERDIQRLQVHLFGYLPIIYATQPRSDAALQHTEHLFAYRLVAYLFRLVRHLLVCRPPAHP